MADTDGALIETVGGSISIDTGALGPAAGAWLPAASAALPARIEMLIVPMPERLRSFTFLLLSEVATTSTVAVAVPVVVSTIKLASRIFVVLPCVSTLIVTGSTHAVLGLGAPIVMTGAVLSTVNVALGPAAGAGFPPDVVAVPDASEIPSVPSPDMPEIVTVRVNVPEPDTPTVPVAVPVVFSVTFAFDSVTAAAFVYEMVYVIGPVRVIVLLGELMETLTAVLSTVNVPLGPAAAAMLPARSDAVPAAMLIPIVPEPVMLEIVTVRVVVPVPVTENAPLAVPVLLSVMLPVANVTASAPIYVIV